MDYKEAVDIILARVCCDNEDFGCDECPMNNGDNNECQESATPTREKEALEILKNGAEPTDYLTTDELIKDAEAMGYVVKENESTIWINRPTDYEGLEIVAKVGKGCMFIIDTYWSRNNLLRNEDREKLYNLLDRYARTPLDKRTAEKRFMAYIKGITSENHKWLNEFIPCCDLQFESAKNSGDFKTIFTAEELSKHEKTLGFTLERVEVE